MDNPPIFWWAMTYACDHCGHEERFLLEEGCEGPRDREVPALLPEDHPVVKYGGRSREMMVPLTAGGRKVVPVPFIAGCCPKCNADGRGHRVQGRYGRPVRRGYLKHVRWNEDAKLDPRPQGIPEGPHFRYPDDPTAEQACGMPVYLGDGRRRE